MRDIYSAYKARFPDQVVHHSNMGEWLDAISALGDNVKLIGGASAPGSNQIRGLPANSLIGPGNLLDIPREGTGSTLFAPGQVTGGPRGFGFGQAQESVPLRSLRRFRR